MGQLTQTTAQVQVILDDADAANVGKTSLTDSTDTTAVAVRKSGFYSLSASSSNAPSTDRAILISAVRDTTATGEIRYGQVAITESNGMWWNRDDGGTLGTWYEAVSTAGTQTLTNKTLTSPVLTTPQINDTSANHQYVFAVSELAADRTVTLPLLTGNDTFVFEAHTQTLTNKTLTSPVFNTGVTGTAILDADDFTGASATTLATSESIKAYVDSRVGSFDTLAEVLAQGNTTGSTNIVVTAGQSITTDTIAETTSAAGVTVDSLLIKDGGITAAGTSTFAGQTISDLGTVTTANIDGGSIDGTTIGASTAAAITGTTITATDDVTLTGASYNVVWDSSDNQLEFADNAKAVFGADSDLSVYHNGSNGFVENDTGLLILKNNSDDRDVAIQSDDGSGGIVNYLLADGSTGALRAYHYGSLKLATTSTGIDVTGTVTADGLTLGSEGDQISIPTSSGSISGIITTGDTISGNAFEFKNGNAIVLVSDTNDSATTGGVDATLIARGSSATKTALFDANGDISFYDSAGSSQALFWDASAESLGIGTSSPGSLLTIGDENSGSQVARIQGKVTGASQTVATLEFNQFTNAPAEFLGAAISAESGSNGRNSSELVFKVSQSANTDATEAMRLDRNGDLQLSNATDNIIRTGSDSSRLRIFGGSTESISNGAALTLQGVSHSGGNYADLASAAGGYVNFRIGSSDAMRIDSSGNLLVGTTNVNPAANNVTGHALKAGGLAEHANSGAVVMRLNRTDSDGSILDFYKGTSTVGSIGTLSGNASFGSGDVHLNFNATSNVIEPMSTVSGGASNGAIDLGGSLRRFKDFYLSGEIYNEAAYNQTTGLAANMYVNSAGRFFRSTSSERYKNSIQDATHGLTELLTLRPVTYKGNDDGDLVFGGLIAEEVHDAGLTEFVQYNEEDQPDALAYGNMVSLCIKAIQEQQDLIESLTARIAALEGAN